jgi:hypothetical protein
MLDFKAEAAYVLYMNQNDLPILPFPALIKGVNALIIFILSLL